MLSGKGNGSGKTSGNVRQLQLPRPNSLPRCEDPGWGMETYTSYPAQVFQTSYCAAVLPCAYWVGNHLLHGVWCGCEGGSA